MSPRLALALLIALPMSAHAQDGGVPLAVGFSLTSPISLFDHEPFVVDAQRRILAKNKNSGALVCLDSAQNVLTTISPGFNEEFRTVAVDPSRTELWVVSLVANSSVWHLRLQRVTCVGGLQGTAVDLPSQPTATLADEVPANAWVQSVGVVEYANRSGVWRVETTASVPAAQVVFTGMSVLDALGEAPPLQTIRACSPLPGEARLCTVGTLVGQSAITVDASGLLITRVAGPVLAAAPIGLWLVNDAPSDTTFVLPWLATRVFTRARAQLGVFGHQGRRFNKVELGAEAMTQLGGINRIIPGAPGEPWAVVDVQNNGTWSLKLFLLSIDGPNVDLDQDSLLRGQEDALGTSDSDDDSDHDGVNDAVEAEWFHTSPVDAGSRPPALSKPWQWGVSARPALEGITATTPSLPAPACPAHDPGPCAPCKEGSGSTRPASGQCLPLGGGSQPTTPDEQATFIGRVAGTKFSGIQRLSDDPVLFPVSTPFAQNAAVFAVDAETLYTVAADASGTRLLRFTPAGDEELSMQTGCPLARQVPGCEEHLNLGPVKNVVLLGAHGQRKAVFAHVQATWGWALATLDTLGFHFLRSTTDIGVPFVDLGWSPTKGEFFLSGNNDSAARETWRFSSDFTRAEGERTVFSTSSGPAFPFARFVVPGGGSGFPTSAQSFWFVDPEPAGAGGGCVSYGATRVCDFTAFPSTPVPIRLVVQPQNEWLEEEPGLRPGDVLSAHTLESALFPPRWGLAKISRRGGLSFWLYESEWRALIVDPIVRGTLETQPLGQVGAMSVSPDGLKVCLVEWRLDFGGSGRAWELTLDSSNHRPSQVRQVLTQGPRACAYDELGGLVLAGGRGVVREDGTVLAANTTGAEQGLARLGGRWVTWGQGQPAFCVDGAGQTTTGWDVLALSPFSGGVAWVDQKGQGFVGSFDELCDRLKVPRERLSESERPTLMESLYNDIFTPLSRRKILFTSTTENQETFTAAASLVLRPDGTGYFGAWNRKADGVGFRSPLKGPDLAFVFEPALHPVDEHRREPALDAFRNETTRWTILTHASAGALALVPGADASGDWGHLRETTPWVPGGGWPAPLDLNDGGTGTGGGGGGDPMSPPSCGCHSVGALPVLLLVLLTLRRRRD